MSATGLFVVTNPRKVVTEALNLINQHVRNTLYIQILPRNYPQTQKSVSGEWKDRFGLQLPSICRTVMNVYSNVSLTSPHLDTRVLLQQMKKCEALSIQTQKQVEVVIFDSDFKSDDVDMFVKTYVSNLSREFKIFFVPESSLPDLDNDEETNTNDPNQLSRPRAVDKIQDFVVLGGTFDRLHNGHKILLSEATLRCCKKLTIGVTNAAMVKNKILCELIESCGERMKSVYDFVIDVDPSILYDIVPIEDPFGPTKSDPSLQLIVVSGETYKGALKVNELRKENGLSQLEIHEIPLLPNESKQSTEEEDKMSSSALRMHLLGTTIKIPQLQPRAPLLVNSDKVPYIIGLTGGIASGKSSVSKHLENLGAALINCDILGHQAYRKGQPCYYDLQKEFGPGIIGNDEEINRQALGKLVFDDKEKLTTLNSIVWPHILELLRKEVLSMGNEGKRVIVVEAAVLLKAHWNIYCNEVWTCIIPQAEAIRRLQERAKLDYEECEKRVLAQTTNFEAVAAANVIISTLWSKDYTQKQVERGWRELQCRVNVWLNSQNPKSSPNL